MDRSLQDLRRPPAALWIGPLVVASLALTLGFACALPLAAFATIAALAFDLVAGVLAVLAVWLANQIVGFTALHYPMDSTTFAWGGALGLLGLASLAAARASLARVGGLLGACLAFLAAFVAYEGLLFVFDVGVGQDPSVFLFPVVGRIFAINVAAFGVFLAARSVLFRASSSRFEAAPKLRRV
jgi:hypothetical protein